MDRIDDELGEKIYPGTEVMADVGSHHFVKSGKSDRVLVPQPSQDPHDPLVCAFCTHDCIDIMIFQPLILLQKLTEFFFRTGVGHGS